MTSYLKVILKPAKCKFTWIQLIRVFSTKRKYGVVWNIYSPCLWKTACNLKCTQLRIAHYATMYQSQSVCISRPCSRGTVFFTKHVVCAFQRAVMVSHPEPLIFALHTQWTQLKGCTDSKGPTYNIVPGPGVKTYKCTDSKGPTYNATLQHCTRSQNLQVMGHTSASPLSYLTKCQHSSLSKSQISPKSSSTPCLCFSEPNSALDMYRIGGNQSCQYFITLKQKFFNPKMQKMHASKTCAIDLHFLIRRGGRHGCRLAVADFHVRWHHQNRHYNQYHQHHHRHLTFTLDGINYCARGLTLMIRL